MLPEYLFSFDLQISNGKWFRQMELSYFDYLQQANMMAVISCEHSAMSRCMATPAVSCNSTNVTVKLPLRARLHRVEALGKDAVFRNLTTTPEAEFVQISTQSDTVRMSNRIKFVNIGERANTSLLYRITSSKSYIWTQLVRCLQSWHLVQLKEVSRIVTEEVLGT